MDSLKEIFDAFGQRIKSPVFGYILIAFVACNWKPLYYVFFSGDPALEKFSFFDANTDAWSLYLLPLIFGLLSALFAPWVSNWGAWWATKPTNEKRIREVNEAHKVISAKNKWAAERETEKANKEQALIDAAKRDLEIKEIDDDDVRKDLVGDIVSVREQHDQSFDLSEKEIEGIASRSMSANLGKLGEKIVSKKSNSRILGVYNPNSPMKKNYMQTFNISHVYNGTPFGTESLVKDVRDGDTVMLFDGVKLSNEQEITLVNLGVRIVHLYVNGPPNS